jgi:hypothetical protein
MAGKPVRYPHRHNIDGTHDSICIKCFATVSTKQHEAHLAEEEKRHVCEPSTLPLRGTPPIQKQL